MADAVRSLAVIEIARSCLLLVPASAAYSVVADIERYPDFLPACESVRVLSREQDSPDAECPGAERIGVERIGVELIGPERVDAEVVASKAGANFTFVTRNTGVLNESVSVVLIEGPFDALEGEWHFKALGDAGCRVDFRLSFAASGLLSRLINPIAHSVADRMVDAFSHRITALADRAEAF
jgi:ribosome-associated toxin RatA of RatAB toxin-antitoxin module